MSFRVTPSWCHDNDFRKATSSSDRDLVGAGRSRLHDLLMSCHHCDVEEGLRTLSGDIFNVSRGLLYHAQGETQRALEEWRSVGKSEVAGQERQGEGWRQAAEKTVWMLSHLQRSVSINKGLSSKTQEI